MHERTLRLMEAKLDPGHPLTLMSRHNLAAAYQEAGRVREAIALHEPNLKYMEARLGPDNFGTLTGRHNLAVAYQQAGDEIRAEPLIRRNLAFLEKTSGPQDPRLVASLAMLGYSLLKQGKPAEAEPIVRRCLAIREAIMPDHWLFFNTRSMLGGCLVGQEKYAEAERMLLTSYEGLKTREARIPSMFKDRLAEAAGRIVALYQAWGRPDQARAWQAKLGLVDLPDDVFAPPAAAGTGGP